MNCCNIYSKRTFSCGKPVNIPNRDYYHDYINYAVNTNLAMILYCYATDFKGGFHITLKTATITIVKYESELGNVSVKVNDNDVKEFLKQIRK